MGIRDVVAAAKVTRVLVDAEACGQKVKIPERLSAGELLAIAASEPAKRAAARVAACIHDEAGAAVFDSAESAGSINWETFESLLDLTSNVKGLEINDARGK